MIGTKIQKPVKNGNEYTELANWCNANNARIVDNGEYYEAIENPAPTTEEIQFQLTEAVQSALDDFAKTRGYDGIMSACSYSNSTDAQFKLEADYCIQLRDTTWRMGYAILAEVKAGTRPIPSVEELIAELPVGSAKWPDEE